MFVLCPHCHFLVATDPASGQPPLRCARCHELLVAATDAVTELATKAPALDTTQLAAPSEPAADAPEGAAAAVVEAEEAPLPSTPDSDEPAGIEPDTAEVAPAPDSAPEPAPVPARSRTRKPRKKNARAKTGTSVPAQAPPPDAAPPVEAPPGFVRRQRARITRSPHTQRWMIAAIAALSLLLVLQLLLADRTTLARDARWRPGMSLLCGALGCTLPAWREPAAMTLLDRDVRPRPGMPGVLRVTATFRNDARWAQPWPSLLLTLSDLDGRAVGARVFSPREYLGATPTQPTLASGQSAMLSMDVLEPGPRIVAFTFDFR